MSRKHLKKEENAWTRPLSKTELVMMLLGGASIIFLFYLLDTKFPAFGDFAEAYPHLVVPTLMLIIVFIYIPISLIVRGRTGTPKCPQCNRAFEDITMSLDDGMVRCVYCGYEIGIDELVGEDEAEFLLNVALNSDDMTAEDKAKIEDLKNKLRLVK